MGPEYNTFIEPIWKLVNIYEGPEVFLETFSKVRREAGLLYAAHFCASEICNGGFKQFFTNNTGVLAPEAVLGFGAVGQTEIVSLLLEAMSIFGPTYIRDRELRESVLDEAALNRLDSLDQKFFELIGTEVGGFNDAADAYAAQFSC